MMIFWRWHLLPPPFSPQLSNNEVKWISLMPNRRKCEMLVVKAGRDEPQYSLLISSEQKLKCKCGCHQSPLIKTTDVPNTATLRQHRADQYDVWIPSQRTLPFPAWSGVGMFCGLCSGVKPGVSSDVKSGVLWCVKCGVRYNEEDWWPQLSKSVQFQVWTELHCFSALCMIYGDSSSL